MIAYTQYNVNVNVMKKYSLANNNLRTSNFHRLQLAYVEVFNSPTKKTLRSA